jgi:hypothetical protein
MPYLWDGIISEKEGLFCKYHKNAGKKMTLQRHYGAAREGVWFSLDVEREEYVAFISTEALNAHFRTVDEKSSQLSAYKDNRAIINAVARQKFLSGASRPVKLDVVDFAAKGRPACSLQLHGDLSKLTS